MKNLIIGSSGLLGSSLLELLVSKNIEVEVMNRSLDQGSPILQHFIKDIKNIKNEYETVYYLAAYIPYKNKPIQDIKTNIELNNLVAEHFHKSRIIYASSVSVYGNLLEIPATEKHPLNPISSYAESKLHGEELLKQLNSFGILRFSSLYGKNMQGNTFIKSLIDSAYGSKKINIIEPDRKQDYLYIEEAAEMLYALGSSSNNDTYNGVSGVSISNMEVVTTLRKLLEFDIINLGGETASFGYSRDKFDTYFNIRKYSLEEGLSLTLS